MVNINLNSSAISFFVSGQTTAKGCTCLKDSCNSTGLSNTVCSTTLTCHKFRTITNEILCAPAIECNLFDSCGFREGCPTTTIAVVDSCCSACICIPKPLLLVCNQPNATVSCKYSFCEYF